MKFLFFRADWCDPCRRMAPSVETTFDNNDIKSRYTLERINVDENPELAFKMKINSVPTCVIVDDNGKERSRRVGAMPQRKIMEWLETDFNSTLTLALKAPVAMVKSVLAKKCKLGGPWSESEDFRRTCPDMIHFNPDSAEITLSAAGDLYKQMDWIKKHRHLNILIEGHCDGTGTREYNLALGEKRAQAVKDFFASHMNMSEHRVSIISYGKERPLTFYETDDQDRALNRRALTLIQ